MEKVLISNEDVKVYLVEGESKKTGNKYTALRIEFDEDSDLDKMLFLNNKLEIREIKKIAKGE